MSQPWVETCSRWCSVADVLALPGADEITDPDVTIPKWIDVASWLLFHASGLQWPGSCTDTVRPCRRGGGGALYSSYSWGAWRWVDSWGTGGCGGRSCGCSRLSEITLGASPILDITEVLIDGVALAETDYRVDDYRWLVRVSDDGEGWPSCQDLRLAATEVGTFQVRFAYGGLPPEAGKQAAAFVAAMLALDAQGTDCALPARLRSLNHQGSSYAILDPFEFLDKGRTGLWLPDQFLRQANPHGLTRNGSVHNPDIRRPVRRVSDLGGS